MKCLPRPLSIVAALALLAACGQQGPLVLPDAPKAKRTVPALPGLRRTPGTPSPPAEPAPPSQAPLDAAPVPQPPVTPAATSPR